MKNLKINHFVAVSLIMLFSTVAFAQHDHGSHGGESHSMSATPPPHGGVIKDAGKYKIEMVAELFLKKDQLRFYLLKSNLKQVPNTGITGTITIKTSDGKETTQPLQAKGDEFFVAQLTNSDSFHAVVEFKIKGKTISTMYMHGGVGEHKASITYSCPMHPEVTSDSPGKCSKCGMNLTEEGQQNGGGHQHNH